VKICKKCGIEKPEDQFSFRGNQLRGECLDCERAYRKSHYQKNAERLKAASRKWREENPERNAARKRIWNQTHQEHSNRVKREWHATHREQQKEYLRKRVYGLSSEQYRGLLESQNGKCAICLKESRKLCVDHDHITGRVRGLLCSLCNAYLGRISDSVESLQRAILHIQR
jgi:hypothetical protein